MIGAGETQGMVPESYRDFFENTHDMVLVADRNGLVEDANRSLLERLGYLKDELIGLPSWELINLRVDAGKSRSAWRTLERKGRIDDFETVWRCNDGEPVNVCLDATARYRDDGDFNGAYVIARDITERLQLEEDLRESDGRYRQIIETTNEGIWMIDAEDMTTFVNARMAEMLGYSVDEMMERSVFSFMDAKNSDFLEKKLERRRKGVREQYELQFIRKDGSSLFGLLEGSPLVNKEGRYIGAFAMITDITKRKRAEKDLLEREQAYETLFSQSPDGILVADAETKGIEYANPAACKMFGCAESDMRELSVADLHPEDEVPRVIAEFEAQASGEKTLVESLPCRKKDGTVFYADINSAPASIEGRACLVGFFRDVTDSKKMKDELLRARCELEEKVEDRTRELSKTITRLKQEMEERRKAEREISEQVQTLKALFEESFDGILVADAETRAIKYVNPASCSMFGYKQDEMQELSVHDLHPREDLERVFDEFEAQIKCEKTLAESVPCLRKNGTVFYADVNSTLALIQARRCFVGFFRDVTEQRQMEKEL